LILQQQRKPNIGQELEWRARPGSNWRPCASEAHALSI